MKKRRNIHFGLFKYKVAYTVMRKAKPHTEYRDEEERTSFIEDFEDIVWERISSRLNLELKESSSKTGWWMKKGEVERLHSMGKTNYEL